MQNGKNLAKVILPAFLCLLTMLLAACGGGQANTGNTTKAPANQQVYRWSFALPDINSFDPGIATDQSSLNAINMVFTGLVQLDDHLNVQPQMAQSWDESADHMTYTFHLRPNLKFSDGTPLTSKDVAYTIDRSLSPAVNNQSGVALTYLGLIQGASDRTTGKVKTIIGTGVQTPDDNTVVIHITKPAAYFLGALTYPTSYVVEKKVIDQWGDKWTDHLGDNGGQGGAGPFMVKKYDHSTGIVFVPNPNYYGPKPQLKEVDYVPFKDGPTAYNAFLAGQVDYAGVPANLYTSAKKLKEFISVPSLTIFSLNFNYLDKPLDNIKVRQALSLAINRVALNQAAFHGAYIPSCHIIPQGMYGYNPNLTCPGGGGLQGDPVKAKQLLQQGLQEEGATPAIFQTLTFMYPDNNPTAAAEVTTIMQMWKQVLGITIPTTTKSQNQLYNLGQQTTGHAGPIQMSVGGWIADYPDPQDWTTLQFGKGQPYNNQNYGQNNSPTAAQQQALQQQMEQADVNPDKTARAQAYNQI